MSNFLETYTTKIKTWANAKFCTEDGIRELIDSIMLYPPDSLPKSEYRYTLVTLPLYLVGQTKRLMGSVYSKEKTS